jgi:Protein of unknown function (DUF3631)
MQIQKETAHLATDTPLDNTAQKTGSKPEHCDVEEPSWTVFPGDWIAHYPRGSKPAPTGFPADPKCEVCGEPGLFNDPCLPDTHYWYNIPAHTVRCQSCQEAHWWADGYEISEFGFPSCWNHKHNREERIAERERNQLQQAAHYRAHNGEGEYCVLYQSLLAQESEQVRRSIEQLDKTERIGWDMAELMDAIVGMVRRYVVFPLREQAIVIATWVVHTWLVRAFDYTPYLFVFSASKRSGKSRVLEVIELLARNPEKTEGANAAALIRSNSEDNPPTMLLDEMDALYSKKNDAEAENTRRFLNAGYRIGSKFLRCVGQGADIKVSKFPAFCPKALAGINRCLPDTVLDRSIPIELVRQSRETRAERFREREVKKVVAPLRAELEAFVQRPGLLDALRDARPVLPEALNDRMQDITEPLIAIADLAGGHWPESLRSALVKLCGEEEDEDIGVKLLAAIKKVFDSHRADKLPTEKLLGYLVDSGDDAPWSLMWLDDIKQDKIQKAATKLARRLKPYKIKARKVRIGKDAVQGYCRADFEGAWKTYSIDSAYLSGTSGTLEQSSISQRENICSTSVPLPVSEPEHSIYDGELAKCSTVPAVPLTPTKMANSDDGEPESEHYIDV